jgi:hypothetical protein
MAHGSKHDPHGRLDSAISSFRERAMAKGTSYRVLTPEDAHEAGEFLLELKALRNEMRRYSSMIRAVAGAKFSRGECADAMAGSLRNEGFQVEVLQQLDDGGPMDNGKHAVYRLQVRAFSVP